MDFLKSFPALEGLTDLANRNDIDISPTLLRVLTDLYVTKPAHAREEERQYTELVLRLLDVVDVSARHRLAQRLASYPAAPLAVVRRLASDVIAVAEPILRQSRVLSGAEFLAIAQKTSAAHVAALAARADADSQPQARIDAGEKLFSGSVAPAEELNQLFFAANAMERRLIVLNLDYAPFKPAKPIGQQLALEAVRRLESAALSHNGESFVRELARPLGISYAQARRIANDPTGEPIAIAAKALGMPADVLQRILLCLNPAISQSVQRVYGLADLYEEINVAAALRLLAIWQAVSHKPQAAAHQPQYMADKSRVRTETATPQRRIPVVKAPDQRSGTRRS
jgi:uncharacterized protein (DUF2336 family)